MRIMGLIYTAGCLLFLLAPPIGANEFAVESCDQYQVLNRYFSDGVRVALKPEGSSFEFCPDNTCDLIEASKAIPVEAILDFGLLYTYYFSNYYVLREWRNKPEVMLLVERILAKPQYAACSCNSKQEQARCILKKMSGEYHIALYAVRYDEGERHVNRVSLP